jgi:hypothetical protein
MKSLTYCIWEILPFYKIHVKPWEVDRGILWEAQRTLVNILRQGGRAFFCCKKTNQTINSTVSITEKSDPVEYWPGVKFLQRILTSGSLFYGRIFLQSTWRKVTPIEYWRGSHLYVEKWPPGHYSTEAFFYNLHGEKWPQSHKFYGKGSHFSSLNIDRGSNFYVEKWPWGQYSTGVISLLHRPFRNWSAEGAKITVNI